MSRFCAETYNLLSIFRYYGLWLWFPELFNKLDKYYKYHPGEKVSVCEVTSFEPPATNVTSTDPFCQVKVVLMIHIADVELIT